MHTLIIDCTAFLLHLAVYALDADGEVYQKEYMSAEDIPAFANTNKDIKSIKLTGPKEYCMGLKETLENKLALEYANHNIEIEVI
jgi:hypothetical protein